MTKLEIILLVVSLAFLVIACYAVPLLVQLRKTAADTAVTMAEINQRLPLIMKNLEEITTHMNRVTTTLDRRVDDLSLTVEKMNSAMNFYIEKELFFRQQVSIPVANTLRTYGAVLKGVRVFFDSLKTGTRSWDTPEE